MQTARVFLLLCIVSLSTGCRNVAIGTAAPPVPADMPEETINPAISSLRLPIVLPLPVLRERIEGAIPSGFTGNRSLGNFGPAAENNLEWSLARSPITLTGTGGTLNISATIGGTVRVQGKIRPIRGDIGKLLGKLRPSVPYSQSASLEASSNISISPILQSDWSLEPNIDAHVVMTEAVARIADVFDLSFRGEIQPGLDRQVEQLKQQFAVEIKNNRTLQDEARQLWQRLCEPLTVSMGQGAPDLALIISPKGLFVGQPGFDNGEARIMIGLDAILSLGSSGGETVPCPDFPAELRPLQVESPMQTVLSMPITIGYGDLNRLAGLALRDAKDVTAEGVMAKVSRITIGPYGDRLLVSLTGDFKETRWFGVSASGTLHLVAKPILLDGGSALGFSNAEVLGASRAELGAVAATLVSVLAPQIEAAINATRLDLAAPLDDAQRRAEKATAQLLLNVGPLRVRTAKVNGLSVAGLSHDQSALTLQAQANIALEAEVTRLEP
jgi:hypothetical protein